MSTMDFKIEANGVDFSQQPSPVSKSSGPYHRVQKVREQQGMSLRSVSRKLNLTSQEVRQQEQSNSDLKISDLLRWQKILEVPLTDLLIDNEGPLSEPVERRASMLRVMKTAKAILEGAHDRSVKRLANMLVDQLVQIMPELAEVSAWHSVGQRRTQEEVGRIVERSIPENIFNDAKRHNF